MNDLITQARKSLDNTEISTKDLIAVITMMLDGVTPGEWEYRNVTRNIVSKDVGMGIWYIAEITKFHPKYNAANGTLLAAAPYLLRTLITRIEALAQIEALLQRSEELEAELKVMQTPAQAWPSESDDIARMSFNHMASGQGD